MENLVLIFALPATNSMHGDEVEGQVAKVCMYIQQNQYGCESLSEGSCELISDTSDTVRYRAVFICHI